MGNSPSATTQHPNMHARNQSLGSGESSPGPRGTRSRNWKLPAWLDHFNKHDLKIVFRCWVAVWVSFLLIFIQPALVDIGQATFFAAIVLFAVPPAGILLIYLLAACSLLLGMCLAWAWGLLTMKAGLAARPGSETARMVRSLGEQAAANARKSGRPVAWEAQILVHDGFMLDASITAVFWVMGCAFIYVLARLRTKNQKLALTQLFGTIVMDLFLLYGPGLPSYNASLATTLVKPGAIGVALGTACCLLFFPQSTSYTVLDSMCKLISTMETSLNTTRRFLNHQDTSPAELLAIRGNILGIYKGAQQAIGFLPLDISRGRWGAEDVKALHAPIREMMMASLAMLDVHMSWVRSMEKAKKLSMGVGEAEAPPAEDARTEKPERHVQGRREMMEAARVMDALQNAEEAVMHEEAMSSLRQTTAELLAVCSQSIKLSVTCIHTVNSSRWIRNPPQHRFDQLTSELQSTVTALRACRETCVADTTEGVLEAYAAMFNRDGNLILAEDHPPLMRGIMLCMVIEERILVMADGVDKLLSSILRLMRSRNEYRIWVPCRLQYALSWLFTNRLSVPSSGTFSDSENNPDDIDTKDPVSLEEDSKEAYHRLRVSRGYTQARPRRSWFSMAVLGTVGWLFDTAGMFAIRMVVVTIATGIPAVIPHSAGFFYREKGIWAVITAQMCVVIYLADFTFSILTRLLGTLIGGVLAMLAWYIGSGSGPGNPYGLAASVAPMILILVWLRIYLPPAYLTASILGAATSCLVIGYSYDDAHIAQYGLPGRGYEAFWKRLVLVLIGFAAATVAQIFPRPPSATRHISKTLSNTANTLCDHYALLLSHWGRRGSHSPLGAVAEEISIGVSESLASVDGMLALLRYEISGSPFDQASLRQIQGHLSGINHALRRLLDLSASLPHHLQDRLAHQFGLLDDKMIGDAMAVLNIVAQALLTGSPLPERLPTSLVRRFFDNLQEQHARPIFSKALVRDDGYRRYCVAMAAYLKFLSVTDDLVVTMKQTVGERHIVHQWEDV
ncbi:hypothetical protein B0I35DRAFT_452695 [Stachybotrys elegans]|uniref:ER transporter 6TM N-terminal domain-containing protein n=1 Tax=Stachybotrys elegans TaxID=80388 RepID=A0A8K0SL90_9HYPO|nr:hypothetical protein B0I35DRAFT_452695 [Stachybotrys elegans]